MSRSLRGGIAVLAIGATALVWTQASPALGADISIDVPAVASELANRGETQQPTPTTTTTTIPAPDTTGFDSLFIGHSFFRPIALRFDDHALRAGFSDHTQETFFNGGVNGAPMSFWNDDTRRPQIQAVLATGEIDLFGMTYHPGEPDLEGYENWVDDALEHNPDTTFFLGFPWLTDPGDYDDEPGDPSYRATWADAYQSIALDFIIDGLRDGYPGVDFFAIPYGQATVELYQLYRENALPDIDDFVGNGTNALFTDDFGHAGPIILETATLVWLRAIYGVDLSTYSYDSSFSIDLRAIATAIMDAHDPAYNAP